MTYFEVYTLMLLQYDTSLCLCHDSQTATFLSFSTSVPPKNVFRVVFVDFKWTEAAAAAAEDEGGGGKK